MVRLPPTIAIGPQGAARGALRVPGSKSLTNRALITAALAEGETLLRGALVAEDSEVMLRALGALGVRVEAVGSELRVHGAAGPAPAHAADLDLRLSGTSLRFLVAMVALGRGRFRLDGNERMRERPIQESLDALNALGANAVSEQANGCPPVVVEAHGLKGGELVVRGDRSSQFLSGLLLSAPYARGPVTLKVTGELLSKPFIDMTIDMMRDFGVNVLRDGYRSFSVVPTKYGARDYQVEGDAMAAGYFWAAAAVTGGQVTISNLGRNTRQGDARLASVLEEMGCEVAWGDDQVSVRGPRGGRLRGGQSFDLNDMPDQAQTLAVVALFADAPVRIFDVGNMRIKETDRLAAMTAELTRLGALVEEGDSELTVHPLTTPPEAPVALETYGDHRMAMALAVAGARIPNVVIRDPGCVAKTYPRFFDDYLAYLSGALG
ncbi:MAG TPA: 3-phosphoshikimate 1-carboxyvinyltransferase [Trueperaceae bacterium]|nr:3-phosphoshikimate 1-carboxyvinyltransferase [Trueperaceae bacterium]HRP48080.1 3-phosphoshikimate 1-carboxyvinyltransferase [Trueperaceae bacterium]